jgi:hypothetical protein
MREKKVKKKKKKSITSNNDTIDELHAPRPSSTHIIHCILTTPDENNDEVKELKKIRPGQVHARARPATTRKQV